MNLNIITRIEEGSVADEMGVETGDALISINGKEVKDIFDYRYLSLDEYLEVFIRKSNGEEWILEIDKDENEDLGMEFASGLMDEAKSCRNKCIFCFIDQLPRGMRETLYFKDDDTRLSFLQGNYVTLTNMKDEEIDRIIYYHLSPINISVHATDPDVRQFMLKNPKSRNLADQLSKLYNSNIQMNFQIVLCKGVNDGGILDKSIEDLSKLIPLAKSLSVVPAGITRYRENLHNIELFSEKDAVGVIEQIATWQKKLKTKFVFAADEFYIKAGKSLPKYEEYGEFWQIENGVGMMRMFIYECRKALDTSDMERECAGTLSVATGAAAYGHMSRIKEEINKKYPNITIMVYKIENRFFGENITVSGLLTGRDILSQLSGKNLGACVLLPENALRKNDSVFLDDMTAEELEKRLETKIMILKTNGYDFISGVRRAVSANN